jgi:hypothetical protein
MTRARDLADGKFVSLDISGDIDVDGTTNLDAVDIDSAVDINGVVHVSPNTSGKDTFELSTNAVDEGRLRIKNVDTTTVQIRAGGDSYFNGGDVSIGNTSPDARLHVLDTSLPQTKIAYDSTRYMNIEHATIYNVSGASQSNSLKIASRGYSGGNDIIFATGGTDAAGSSEAERMKILSGGNIDISAGHILLDNGYGINFAATSDASGMTSEILDDYEEGTYTPAFTSTGASFSYSVQLGSYVKIGQLVCCWFNITLSASPSGTTSNQLTFNVPFATNNVDNSLYSGGHIGHYFNINLGSGTTIAYQLPSASSTQIELKEVGDNIGENGIVASELNTSAVIRGSVMYRAAS